VVICLERGADLHMAQLMPLPLTVSCFSKIQIGFTFLVSAYPSIPGQRAVKRVCVSVCVLYCFQRSAISIALPACMHWNLTVWQLFAENFADFSVRVACGLVVFWQGCSLPVL